MIAIAIAINILGSIAAQGDRIESSTSIGKICDHHVAKESNTIIAPMKYGLFVCIFLMCVFTDVSDAIASTVTSKMLNESVVIDPR